MSTSAVGTTQAGPMQRLWDREPAAAAGSQRAPELADLHPLRENGTRRYIWWTFERIEDLRPLLGRG